MYKKKIVKIKQLKTASFLIQYIFIYILNPRNTQSRNFLCLCLDQRHPQKLIKRDKCLKIIYLHYVFTLCYLPYNSKLYLIFLIYNSLIVNTDNDW